MRILGKARMPLVLVFLCISLGMLLKVNPARAAGFATKFLRLEAGGFPAVDLTLKVFTKEPTTLVSDNFRLFEDEVPVATFGVRTERPTHYLILALDRSSSIQPAMPEVKRSAVQFIRTMPGRARVGVLSFGSDVDIDRDFTDDRAALEAAVNKIRPYGGTCLNDAVFRACDLLGSTGKRTDIRTVVCLTDGRDCNPAGTGPMSIKTSQEVIEIARKRGIRVFTVGLGSDIDVMTLSKLASMTGGAHFAAADPNQLQMVYQSLNNRLSLEQYLTLSYLSPKPEMDGTLRQVLVKSQWQGLQDQGSGTYRAPLPPPPPLTSQAEVPSSSLKTPTLKQQAIKGRGIKRAKVPMVRETYVRLNSSLGGAQFTNRRFKRGPTIEEQHPGEVQIISSEEYFDLRTVPDPPQPLFDASELERGAYASEEEELRIMGDTSLPVPEEK